MREISILKNERGLAFTWHTFTMKHLTLLPMLGIWGSLLFVVYHLISNSSSNSSMLLFLALHLLVWAVLGYVTLALFFNKAVLLFDRESMILRHTPLPFWGEFEIPIGLLYQFYAEGVSAEQAEATGAGRAQRQNERAQMLLNERADSYRLVAVFQNRNEIRLFSHLSRPEVIFFLQEQIDCWLRQMKAQPVVEKKGGFRAQA
jgi:hypothetical protein